MGVFGPFPAIQFHAPISKDRASRQGIGFSEKNFESAE
jgi:hypothetical protein